MIPKMDEYKKRWEIDSEASIKPGLEAIQEALAKVGNPEKNMRILHVAGTNGKGSTIAFMEGILRQHGFSTGVFSSPALVDIHDQIRLNGQPIARQDLDASFALMKEAGVSGLLTDFELLTVAAFLAFRQFAPDYVLLETGMGGTLDSTNVVTPLVSVITSIALEHTGFLGKTLAEVAGHKAGIIKKGAPVVSGSLCQEAVDIVCQVALENDSPLFMYGQDFVMECTDAEVFKGSETYHLAGRHMKGPHQGVNAAVAIEALIVAGVDLGEEQVATAIATVQLEHRFEEIMPGIFRDGAHNPAAAAMLAQTIQSEFPGEKVDFVIGMLKGKEIGKTLDALIPVAASFTFLTFAHPQAESAERLMLYCKYNIKTVTNVNGDTIILKRAKNRRIIVTGSLYMIAGLKVCIKTP